MNFLNYHKRNTLTKMKKNTNTKHIVKRYGLIYPSKFKDHTEACYYSETYKLVTKHFLYK